MSSRGFEGLRLVGGIGGRAGDVSTHAVGFRCQSLPCVHDACNHLTQPTQRRVRVILVVSSNHGGEVTLELDVGFARPSWIVLAGKAPG